VHRVTMLPLLLTEQVHPGNRTEDLAIWDLGEAPLAQDTIQGILTMDNMAKHPRATLPSRGNPQDQEATLDNGFPLARPFLRPVVPLRL